MKLVSVKISAKDRDARMSGSDIAGDAPAYPYGLSLSLDQDVLDKLKCEPGDFKVGAKMSICANVEVTSVSMNETRGSGESSNVGLQITDMCVEDEAMKKTSAASKLYGEGKS